MNVKFNYFLGDDYIINKFIPKILVCLFMINIILIKINFDTINILLVNIYNTTCNVFKCTITVFRIIFYDTL